MPEVNELSELLRRMEERASAIIVSADSARAAADFLHLFDSGQHILRHRFGSGPGMEYLQDRLFRECLALREFLQVADLDQPKLPQRVRRILGTIGGMLRHI